MTNISKAMRWHVNVRFILCHQMTKAIIKSYIVYTKKPWNNIHGFSYIYIFFPITIQRHQHLQMCVSILSCVNTHDKPAADTYAHSHGYNSLRSLYLMFQNCILIQCYDCMCIFQRKSMYLISVLRFLHNILSLMFLH